MTGARAALERPDGEREWMIVDSYCRQQNWGAWDRGYYVDGATELPGHGPGVPGPLRLRERLPRRAYAGRLSASRMPSTASTACAACAPESRLPSPDRASACS